MSQDLCRCGSISLLVYVLVILFGVSSWVDINGLWVELPILVQNLPEGWDLPSYMSVIIQIANIAPLVYTCASTIWPHRMLEVPVIYIIISLGGVSCLLLAFLWRVTSTIAGVEHSTALFVLQFCLALVDCTSSVAFLPFMSVFKPQYMTAYFTGEGFSGLIPSLIALGQGVGDMKCVIIPPNKTDISRNTGASDFSINENLTLSESVTSHKYNGSFTSNLTSYPMYEVPRFSVKIFFLLLMMLMIISALSFTLLNFWSYCRSEHANAKSFKNLQTDSDDESVALKLNHELDGNAICMKQVTDIPEKSTTVYAQRTTSLRYKGNSEDINLQGKLSYFEADLLSDDSGGKNKGIQMSRFKYVLFLVITAWLNAISNGVLPSIQTYSCLPYGIQEYHLSVTLASIANPVACFASFFKKMKSVVWTLVMMLVGSCLAVYLLWTASASPEPPLVGRTSGSAILILCWILAVFVITYTKVSIATEFREEGKRALMWVGASTQAGSLVGAVAIFLVVNVFKMFRVGNPCT